MSEIAFRIIVPVIFIFLLLDFFFIGLLQKFHSYISPPEKSFFYSTHFPLNDILKKKILEEVVLFAIKTDLPQKGRNPYEYVPIPRPFRGWTGYDANSIINYVGKYLSVILSPQLLIVRNTLLTYKWSIDTELIDSFSFKKILKIPFWSYIWSIITSKPIDTSKSAQIYERLVIYFIIDSEERYFSFKTKIPDRWIEELEKLGIKRREEEETREEC